MVHVKTWTTSRHCSLDMVEIDSFGFFLFNLYAIPQLLF